MTINDAIAIRIRTILKDKNISQYRLELDSGVYHNTMSCLLNGRYKASNMKTVALIIRALDMTISEFFDDKLFNFENLNID